MRVKFTCNALAFSQRRQMHSDAIQTLVVSCADGATYCVCDKKAFNNNTAQQQATPLNPAMSPAEFHVDFDLAPIAPFDPSTTNSPTAEHHWATVCRDTLKFHVFGPERSFIASGFIPMESLFHGLANFDDSVASFQSNASPTSAMLICTSAGSDESKKSAADALEHLWHRVPSECRETTFRSCLHDTEHARVLIQTVAQHTRAMLLRKLATPAETGALLFTDVMTYHGMQDQCTTDMMFQGDMEPPPMLLDLMLDSGTVMYFLSDSLHFTGRDAGEVLALFDDPEEKNGVAITQFMSTVCQSAQRSNTAEPYTPDRVPVIADASTGRTGLMSTEYFARTLSEPYDGRAFMKDDCEGSAGELHNTVLSFGRLAERWGKKKVESRSEFVNLVMPPHMFNMSEADKLTLLQIGVRLGEHVSSGKIQSSIVLVTAGGKSQGGKPSEGLGGHVAHVVISKHRFLRTQDASDIVEILTEGTNLSQSDAEGVDRCLRVPISNNRREMGALCGGGGGDTNRYAEVNLCRVANFITTRMAMSIHHDANTRTCLHMSHLTPDPFYNTAFCQGANLLATDTSSSSDGGGSSSNLRYGVPVREIGDYSKKVFLTTTEDDTLTGISPADYAWLGKHLKARAGEIHTPITSMAKLDAYLRKYWTPTTMYAKPDALKGRQFLNCTVSNPVPDLADREAALRNARMRADAYNRDQKKGRDPNNKHGGDGFAEAWIGMDCVMERISLFTDDTTSIERQLQRAMQHPVESTVTIVTVCQ
jgi:hypothetical protein